MRSFGTVGTSAKLVSAIVTTFTLVTAGASAATFTIGALKIDLGSSFPDPTTWALMLLSFGLIGAGVRSRKRSVVIA